MRSQGAAVVRTRLWLAVAALVLGGCGTQPVSSAPAPTELPEASVGPGSATPDSRLTDVRLGTNSPDLWVLAKEGLFRVAQRQVIPVAFPRPPDWVSEAIATDGPIVTVAVAQDASTVRVLQSADAGGNWTTGGPVSIPTINGISDVRVSTMEGRIAVLANESSGSNISTAMVASSGDGGRTWEVARAPAGGDISSAGGVFWFVGDVMGDRLYVSADGLKWQPVTIPIKAKYWTAGTAVMIGTDEVAIATTSHTSGESELSFWSTADQGRSWRVLISITAPHTEFQATVPTAIAKDGQWVAIWPDGSKVIAGLFGSSEANRIISPNGLPGNVESAALMRGNAVVAEAAPDACPGGKATCSSTPVLAYSPDSGQTWVSLR
jgi:hypothetical protein